MKGLVLDKDFPQYTEAEYRYGKNIVLTDKLGSIINEEGNILKDDIGTGRTIIGCIPILDSAIIFWYNGTNSGIGVMNDSGYQDVADTNAVLTDLSFSYSYPISGKYYINNNGEVIVAFHANNFKPYIVNIGLLSNPMVTNANDPNDILLFPESLVADIDASIVTAGGSLLAGTYYITYAYKNTDTITGYHNISNPLSIQDDVSNYDGCIAGIVTNKSIAVTFTGIDTRYDFIRIGYIYKDSTSIKAFQVKDYVISGTTINITITGTESSTEVTLEELIVPNVAYTRIEDMAVLNDRLYAANLTVRDDIDYQADANNILIDYNYVLKDLTDSTKLEQANRSNGGFIHSEVYAFYIRFWFTDGSVSKYFHIPGREYVVGDGGTTAIAGYGTPPTYQVMPAFDVVGADTNMGYWENEDEYYPSIGDFPTSGDSTGDNRVRHHRFPSMRHIQSLLSGTDLDDYGKTKMSVLGIDVSNVLNIPADVSHWEIGYAKRDYNNCTTYSCGLANYAAYPESNSTPNTADTTVIWSSGLNFNIGEGAIGAGADEWLINDGTNKAFNYVRFNTLDTQLNQPGLSNPYIHIEYRFDLDMTTATGTAANNWLRFSAPANNPFGNDYDRRRIVLDYCSVDSTVTPLGAETVMGIEQYEYLNANSIGGESGATTFYNVHNEATLLLKGQVEILETGDTPVIAFNSGVGSTYLSTTDGTSVDFTSISYLLTLKSLRTNMYDNFYNQDVASTGKLNLESVSTSTGLLGGDAFLCDYSFITTAENAPFNTNDSGVYGGIRAVHRYLGESSANGNLRYEITTNYYSQYYPKSDYALTDTLFDLAENYPLGQEPNQISYNRESSSLNDLNPSSVNNPYTVYNTRLPYRIARSLVQNRESNIINWKQWRSQDYYESVRDKGEISSIEAYADKFFIHHQRSLFVTKDRVKLPTSAGEVQIGAGDIFELSPIEAITAEGGFAGSQNRLAIQVNKLGYCFIDVLQGKVFIHNGEMLNEISNTGLRNFFRDNLGMWQYNISATTRSITATYNSKTNLTTIPKVQVENTIDGKIWYDVIVPANYLNKYGEDYYYRTGDYSGTSSLSVIKRYKELQVGDNPYYGLGYSISYDEKWNRLLLSKIRSCYFTYSGGEPVTRIKYNNQITKTIYTNTATKVDSSPININSVDNIGLPANYYRLNLASTPTYTNGYVVVSGSSFDGTYSISGVGTNTLYIYKEGTAPSGTGSVILATQYWDGTQWIFTSTTWLTYGSAAGAVAGATSQSNDGGITNYFVDGDIFQTSIGTYTTYNSNAQAQNIASIYSPAYSVISSSTQYYNNGVWQSSPPATELSVVKDCSIPYIDGLINGSYKSTDIKFISKLQVGDVVLDESDEYKQWNGTTLESILKYDSWTFSYSPQSNMWVSSHSYKPKRLFNTYNKLYSINDNLIYLHNQGDRTTYYDTKYTAYIDAVFNIGEKVTFTGIFIQTDVLDEFDRNIYDETIDYITVWTNNQCTKKVDVEPLVNIRRAYDGWYYNGLRDSNVYNKAFIKNVLQDFELDLAAITDKRSYDKGKFNSSYIVARIEINNNNQVLINKIEPLYKKLFR